MAKASSPSTQSPVDGLPTPDQYAEFIGQVDLEALWVKDARITNRHGSHTPTHATIHTAACVKVDRSGKLWG